MQELEDSFNYGLFQPPLNGRAGKMMTIAMIMMMIFILTITGKFLDEERRLSEYPFQGSVGHLEVSFMKLINSHHYPSYLTL